MAAKYYIRRFNPPLTLRHQALGVRLLCPWLRLERREKGLISWRGPVQPAGMSERYDIRIFYRMGNSPKVTVIGPELRERADGMAIPHIYPGKCLCLYLPGSGEWTPQRLIAETVVPWASLWLFYYEIWHATGKWSGGGTHSIPKSTLVEKSA